MFPAAVSAEVRWIVIDQFDIGHQPRPRVRAFDQIMAEQRIFGEALVQSGAPSASMS